MIIDLKNKMGLIVAFYLIYLIALLPSYVNRYALAILIGWPEAVRSLDAC